MSGRKALLDNLIRRFQQDVTCAVCSSELQDARILPCLDFYCRMCIEGLRLQMSPNTYVCPAPQCHNEHVIPSLDELPRHFVVGTKKQLIRLLRRVSGEHVGCELCASLDGKNNTAKYVCLSCSEGQQLICDGCSRAHKTDAELRQHCLDELSLWLEPQNSDKLLRRASKSSLVPSALCSQHGYQLRYSCADCSTVNCCNCLRSHQGHAVQLLENAAELAKGAMMQRLVLVEAAHREFQEAAKDIETVRERLQHQEGKREMDVTTAFARVKMEVESRQKAMIQQLHSMAEGKRNKLTLQLHQLEGVAKLAGRLQGLMNELMQLPSLTHLLTHVDFLLSKSFELENRCDLVRKTAPLPRMQLSSTVPSLTPCESPTLAVHIPTSVFQSTLRNKCKVYSNKADTTITTAVGPGLRSPRALEMTYFKVVMRDSSGQPCNQAHGLTVQCCSQNKLIVEHVHISSYVCRGIVNVSYTPRISMEYLVSVRINEEDISGSPFTVAVQPAMLLSADLPPKLLQSLEAMKGAVHISVSTDGRIHVVFKNGNIKVFSQDGDEGPTFDEGPTQIPGGIAVAEDHSLFITSSEHHCISKYSPSGELVSTKGVLGCEEGEFNTPGGVAIKETTGEVFVCDTNNHRVQVFSVSNLEYLREFNINLTAEGLANHTQPVDILVSNHGSLYITDPANETVLVFSSDEKYQFSWSSMSKVLKSPRSIVADSDGLIYISDNHCLLVFQADGDHVATFEDRKYLLEPVGVALDNKGHVYVCDTGRDTVTVFKDTPVKVL